MAGLISRLFGGGTSSSTSAQPDVNPGIGGYTEPQGPTGGTGFPGSTTSVRTFQGASPRNVKLRADTNTGTQTVTETRAQMQGTPATQMGGPMLHTGAGNDTAGANPLTSSQRAGGHSVRQTETPVIRRQPQISTGTPGSANVRNQIALKYQNRPGEMHEYLSRNRPDQGTPSPGGDGTGGGGPGTYQPVSVQNRFVFAGGGVQTWWMEREMPYGGRGDGARGAYLNGQRYYAEGTSELGFSNAGGGQYGGNPRSSIQSRPTIFQQPAPWSAQFYDTTESVGTYDSPGSSSQVAQSVFVSPQPPRANYAGGRANG